MGFNLVLDYLFRVALVERYVNVYERLVVRSGGGICCAWER